MTRDDAPEFLAKLTVLAELFDAKLSEAKQQIYFEALFDLALTDVLKGMNECARYCKFMPKPVEIRDGGVGSHQDNAELQWNLLVEAIRSSVRVVGAIDWDDDHDETPESYAVESVFGSYQNAKEFDYTAEMWQAKRKQFIAAYVQERRIDVRMNHEDALALNAAADKKLLK